MTFSRTEVTQIGRATGFRVEMVEKVLWLLRLLEQFNKHPFLKNKWALKGGTAFNLFLWSLPRLSVDIDLNYIGAVDKDTMLEQRPKLEKAVQAVIQREGLRLRRVPSDHAGGKWRLSYESCFGQSGNLELDVNFMYRQLLWDVEVRDSHLLGSYSCKSIPVVDTHELAAGKLSALLSRKQARDLFDSHRILRLEELNTERLRVAFVAYGGMNRKDWRTVSIDDVQFENAELKRSLLPTLNTLSIGNLSSSYGKHLVRECKESLSRVLPLTDAEREFLDKLLDKGIIEPSLLTDDHELQERIHNQPLLQWKAINVRRHMGFE